MSLVNSKLDSARTCLSGLRSLHGVRRGVTSLLICTAMVISGCASRTDRNLKIESREIAEATTAVKAAMVEADDVDAAAIRVSLDDGTLVLDGFAASEEEKSRAGALAAQHGEGRAVRNKIQVR